MNIALLNAMDQGGGAETVVRALRDGLRSRGHDCTLWVGRRRGEEDPHGTKVIPTLDHERARARRFLDRGFFNLGLSASRRFCVSPALGGADVIHLHNVHGHYFSLTDVPLLAQRARLVWTFHDFFPVTGGCAFPYDCPRWLSTCGACPQLGQYPLVTQHDRTRRLQAIKRKTFAALPVDIITPSVHLGRAVQRSGMFPRADFHTIPYSVDLQTFRPQRDDARRALQLPLDSPIVLLVAQGLDDPRKGIDLALRALERVNLDKLIVLMIGHRPDPPASALATHPAPPASARADALTPLTDSPTSSPRIRQFGYLVDRTAIARCFAAADAMIFTSLAENYPCVVMEAMACGTAVVGFDIDGVNEQIAHERTGVLVPTGDVDALARAIRTWCKNLDGLRSLGTAARAFAETHWGLDRFLDRHERLYTALRSQRAPGPILQDALHE